MEKRFKFINKIWEGILWIYEFMNGKVCKTAEFSIWGETKDLQFLTSSQGDVRVAGFWKKKFE